MLQLGDKRARQSKKILVKRQLRYVRRPSLSSDGHLANSNRLEAYLDALTPSDARFAPSKLEAA
jgi:hypothetical protein